MDFDSIKLNLVQAKAVCLLMAGFCEDDCMDGKSLQALGLELTEKLRIIEENLK